jgi:hypothetical protein
MGGELGMNVFCETNKLCGSELNINLEVSLFTENRK